MKKQIIGITITLILVAILLIAMNFKKSEADSNLPPTLPLDEGSEEITTSFSYILEEDLTPLTSTNILGTWKAISEQVGTEGIVNNNPEDSEITFTEETYSSTTFGIPNSGYYQLKDNQLFFYNSKEDSDNPGNFLIAQGGIRDNTLRIIFPQFPKAVVYEKIR